jgi:hypothetical protein
MAEIQNINDVNVLLNDGRAFLPSKNINIFPCSRRGQYEMTASAKHYDPEARLNTERTNRIHTAINGFKDSFIERFDSYEYTDEENNNVKVSTLIFTLAGYRVEAKNFYPTDIAEVLGIDTDNTGTNDTIYAHLSLHTGISLSAEGYYTEILYRQSTATNDKNYLDVSYPVSAPIDDFFVGVSFTKDEASDGKLPSYNLPLFSYSTNKKSWELVQTSLLPKIEHGETENSIKLSGAFTVKQGEQTSFEINEGGVGTVNVPLHITKATVIDGHVTANASTKTRSLIVGDVAEGEVFPKGTIKAKEHIETPTLEATTSIKTPTLDVKTIENKVDSTGVSINDTLNITAGHVGAADTLKVNTINSRQENGTITVESPVALSGKATLNNGLEVTNGDTTLKKLTAETTTLGNLTVNNVTVTGTNSISTPTLKVNTITSDKAEVTVDRPLKINSTLAVNSGKATLHKGLSVKEGLTVESGGITVSAGETKLQKTGVVGLTDTGSTSLTKLTVTGEATLATVDGTKIIADEIWLAQDTDIQVPAVELVNIKATNTYQLRFKFGKTPITIKEE